MDEQSARELYRSLENSAPAQELEQGELSRPDPLYDFAVKKIYNQAHDQRDLLVDYYVKYTAGFTIVVLLLICIQASVRVGTNIKAFEIMPQWTLNILVAGMFGQFLVLLKVVTENAWNFKSFFDHHNDMRNHRSEYDSKR